METAENAARLIANNVFFNGGLLLGFLYRENDAHIENNILYVSGSCTSQVIDNILTVNGGGSASVEENILIVQ